MMKKILLFLLLSFLMTGSAFANCLMYIDDFMVTPDQLGTVIELRVKALYSARLNAWSLDLTFPEGLTPINAEPGADFDITYINSSGNTAIYTPLYYQYNDYTKLMGFAYEQGYWYDPNNGNALTSYGAVKWEVGTYEEMIVLYVRVSEDFRGGEIVLHSEFSCTDDARGGTIRDVYGQQAIDYTCVCTVTFGSPEAYACYTPSNTTLTFYYDNYRSSRQGTTYDLNVGDNQPAWPYDLYMNQSPSGEMPVTRVVFDPSFADARPKSTYYWFVGMLKLSSITGIEYLNTEKVTNMAYMFADCSSLTSIDVSNFNTAKVTDMSWLFSGCSGLTSLDLSNFNTAKVTDMYGMFAYDDKLATIVVGDGWNTSALTTSFYMFYECASLVGGMGTTFDENHIDAEYAHIDGGPSNPGYLSEKTTGKRGDVNGDGSVNIADVTSLIDYLLSGNASGVNIDAADCNQDSSVNISDVTSLIDYLLSGTWN